MFMTLNVTGGDMFPPPELTWTGKDLVLAVNAVSPSFYVHNLGGSGGATFHFKDDLSTADWVFKVTSIGGFKIRDQASSLDVFIIDQGAAANCIYIKAGGNVGIGTTTPLSKLAVVGLPTAAAGLNAGDIWVDTTGGLNILKIV